MTALAVAFAALVVLGPAFRPWYALWAVLPAACTVRTPAVRTPDVRTSVVRTSPVHRSIELWCAALAFSVMPDGFSPDGAELLLAVGGFVLGAAAVLAAERGTAFRQRQLAC